MIFPGSANSCYPCAWFEILDNNRLTGSIPTTLGMMTMMEKLDIGMRLYLLLLNLSLLSQFDTLFRIGSSDNNELTGQIPSELGLMTAMTELYLGKYCELDIVIRGCNISLSMLFFRYTAGNQLTGPVPSEVLDLDIPVFSIVRIVCCLLFRFELSTADLPLRN